MWWSTSSGCIELQLTQEQVEIGHHSGPCDSDIDFLSGLPEIRSQLEKLDPELVKRELRGYGAWDDAELSDHETNLERLLWLACGDIADEPERYAD